MTHLLASLYGRSVDHSIDAVEAAQAGFDDAVYRDGQFADAYFAQRAVSAFMSNLYIALFNIAYVVRDAIK